MIGIQVFGVALIFAGLLVAWLEDEPWYFVAASIVGLMLVGKC